MNVKTLTGTVPKGRTEIFKQIDAQLKAIDDEATTIRLNQQAEIESLKKQLAFGSKGSERKVVLLNILQEKCEMVKPIILDVLTKYGDELPPDQARKLEDFIGFSLPAEDQQDPSASDKLSSAIDIDNLKKMFGNGIGAAAGVASSLKDNATSAAGKLKSTGGSLLSKTSDIAGSFQGTAPTDVDGMVFALAEGEVPFTDEIDISHEIAHWGVAIQPEAKNSVSLIKDPKNPDKLIPTAYKFNLKFDKLVSGQVPSFHIDLDDNYEATIIRFHGGPPYQDRAYRISPLSWFLNPELGYVNKFENGLFQLHFHLKRK